MAGKLQQPRYHQKPHPGRPAIDPAARRRTISLRVNSDTYQYLTTDTRKAGREVDRLVQRELRLQQPLPDNAGETLSTATHQLIQEMANGFAAMIYERGTSHLSAEQIEILSTNFSLLINNYSATFKRNPRNFAI